jgi:hypothetical protein
LFSFLVLFFVMVFNFLLTMFYGHSSAPKMKFQTGDNSIILPESERPLEVCVLGVDPDTVPCFFMPELREGRIQDPARDIEIREQLFWLRFELSHGQIFNALPISTLVYVALPDPKFVKESHGWEEGWLKDYLEVRCHWTKNDIRQRLRFFKTHPALIWTQDVGKMLGKDSHGRRMIFLGPQDQDQYRCFVKSLCDAYPGDFVERELPRGVSAEGGDEDLVRAPSGEITFFVGRHRALRYLEIASGASLLGQDLDEDRIAQARVAFSSAFEGLPVVFVSRDILRNPELGNEEMFHLDMSAAVVGNGIDNQAFVPTYIDHPVDRMSGLPLDPDFVKSLQAEYDAIASQLKEMGFPVNRLQIDDHPVRSPANLVRFYDPSSGRCKVLLAKYPSQVTGSADMCTQEVLRNCLGDLKTDAANWEKEPTVKNYLGLKNGIQAAWNVMDRVPAESDKIFEDNAALFRKAGIEVVPVADFAWGAGGLHCQMLH